MAENTDNSNTKSRSILRKLSVIYLFLVAFGAFMAFYFFKFIPDNRSNLEARCYRQLRSLSGTVTQKVNDISAIFDQQNIDINKVREKKDAFQRLNDIYTYDIAENIPAQEEFFIRRRIDELSAFYFHVSDSTKQHPNLFLSIGANELLNPVFTSQDDLFDSYILLKTEPSQPGENRPVYDILYQSSPISSSQGMHLDTLIRLQKNSDLSSVIDLNISGIDYHIFLSSFQIQQEKLILLGLMKKGDYLAKVNRAPGSMTAFFFVVLLVLLISLPFFKIFLLSPREHVGFADLIYCGISLFAGFSLLIITLLGIFTAGNRTSNSQEKLNSLSTILKTDFEQQLDSCKKQLRIYDEMISHLNTKDKKFLFLTDSTDSKRYLKYLVNNAMNPSAFKNIQRVFWLDDAGQTKAKWSTVNFFVNFTKVSSFPFFSRLKSQSREDTSFVIYPVFSNATGEFQVVVTRKFLLPHDNGDSVVSKNFKYSVLAGFFSVSASPVIEKNFDFSIIDNQSGNVFFSSDKSQNLQLNFSEELHNSNFQNALNTRSSSLITDAGFKDKLVDLYIVPIKDFPLSLVVYYDKGVVYDRVLRIVYFTTEMILTIYFLIVILLGWYGIKKQEGSGLNMSMNKIEWFRISDKNKKSYQFTAHYFFTLIILTIFLFLIVILFNLDIRSIFYISFFLPFFVVWGFLCSRLTDLARYEGSFKMKSWIRFIPAGVFSYNFLIVAFLFLLNFVVLRMSSRTISRVFDRQYFILYIFELAALVIMALVYYDVYNKEKKWLAPINNLFVSSATISRFGVYTSTYRELYDGQERKNIIINYLNSLFMGMLLVSVIPVLGVFLYAEKSQRIQDLKSSELFAATRLEQKIQYINRELIDNFDVSLKLRHADFAQSMELFKKKAGIYNSHNHIIYTVSDTNRNSYSGRKTVQLPDAFYYSVLHISFPFAFDEKENDNMPAFSGDDSWEFHLTRNQGDSLFLHYKSRVDTSILAINVHAGIRDQVSTFVNRNFFSKIILLLLLISLVYGCFRVVGKSIRRLFLLDYFLNHESQRRDSSKMEYMLSNNNPSDFTINKDIDLRKISTEELFKIECEKKFRYSKICSREEFILAMQNYFHDNYEQIWQSLDRQEQYVTYDVCTDGYTNYKDMDIVYRLMFKGILVFEDYKICPFSLSFQNYILSKKRTTEIRQLKSQVAVAGTWEAFRIPVLIVMTIIASFLVITQDTLVHQATALITSVGAIFHLLSGFASKLSFGRMPK